MRKLSILFLGPYSGTSRHRVLALGRLGHSVYVLDPRKLLPDRHAIDYWIYHVGPLFLESVVRRRVFANLPRRQFDLILVDGGELVGPSLIRELRNLARAIINYNIDDPFYSHGGRKWRLYKRAIREYDLTVFVRECNVPEAVSAGARHAFYVSRSADEVVHKPRHLTEVECQKWTTKVLFVGTWKPERGRFLAQLLEHGVPLSIYGDRWSKAREWRKLQSYWRGAGPATDDHYAKLMQSAKVCLGLPSIANRDGTTQRSVDIPHLGVVLCAQRTSEHLKLYKEGVDAVFWSNPEECARQCETLLNNQEFRQLIAKNGQKRCLQNGTLNEQILDLILGRALPARRRIHLTPVRV